MNGHHMITHWSIARVPEHTVLELPVRIYQRHAGRDPNPAPRHHISGILEGTKWQWYI